MATSLFPGTTPCGVDIDPVLPDNTGAPVNLTLYTDRINIISVFSLNGLTAIAGYSKQINFTYDTFSTV